jgi:hypothetical protein
MWAARRAVLQQAYPSTEALQFCIFLTHAWCVCALLFLLQVLIVGDSGLGKTTLVKTLLSTPGERLQVRLSSNSGQN